MIATFRSAGLRFSRDGCAFLAQALAFNAIFAIFPIMILAFAVLGYVYGSQDGQSRVIALIGNVAPELQSALTENMRHVVEFRGVSGILASLALIWSGKNLFQGLAYALNKALDVPAGRPLLVDILVALVMLPVLGVLLTLATAIPLVVSFVVAYGPLKSSALVSQVAGYGTGFILIFVVTMGLYTYLPNKKLGLRFGIPGALFVTIAWEIAQVAFGIYSTHVNFRHVYGALGAFAALLVWFYYMATIFLFGAELCAQLETGA